MGKVEIDLDVLTQEMDEAKDAIARLKYELKKLEEKKERLELTLISVLNQADVPEMNYSNYTFGLKTQQRKALDQQMLKEKYKDIYEKCYTVTESQKFYFKIN